MSWTTCSSAAARSRRSSAAHESPPRMKARVAVLAGDGVGPEVIAEGLRCLHAIAELFGHEFELTPLPFGGPAIDTHANPLPERTLSACLAAEPALLRTARRPT